MTVYTTRIIINVEDFCKKYYFLSTFEFYTTWIFKDRISPVVSKFSRNIENDQKPIQIPRLFHMYIFLILKSPPKSKLNKSLS